MLDQRDIRIDGYTASGRTEWLRATHIPTGTVVEAVRGADGKLEPKGSLLKRLEARLTGHQSG
jgi:protein subunit release factor A